MSKPLVQRIAKVIGCPWASSKVRVTAHLSSQTRCYDISMGFMSPSFDLFSNNLYKLGAELSSPWDPFVKLSSTVVAWGTQNPCGPHTYLSPSLMRGLEWHQHLSQLPSTCSTPSIPSHLCWCNGKSFIPGAGVRSSPSSRMLAFGRLLLIFLFPTLAAIEQCWLFILLDAVAECLFSLWRTLLARALPCEVQTGFHGCSVLHLSHLKFSSCFISQFD